MRPSAMASCGVWISRLGSLGPVALRYAQGLRPRGCPEMHQAGDYTGTIEALKARKLEFARFDPASYAQAWLITAARFNPWS